MKIGLIGAGSMATALARGLGEPVLVYDVVAERAKALAGELDGKALTSAVEVAAEADLVVLCHKPAQLDEVAAEAGSSKALASIMAGVRTEQLEAAYPGAPIYRFIPNVPVEVGAGFLCYAPGARAAEGPEAAVLELFGRLGTVLALEEPQLDPATALMSCGPAFMALIVEELAAVGVRHGLDPEDAVRMCVETMAGTAAYLSARGLDPEALRSRVATPGGLTERGLQTLADEGLGATLGAAVDTVVEGIAR